MENFRPENLSEDQKIKLAKKIYHRAWRKKNREKLRQREREFWLRKFEKLVEKKFTTGNEIEK